MATVARLGDNEHEQSGEPPSSTRRDFVGQLSAVVCLSRLPGVDWSKLESALAAGTAPAGTGRLAGRGIVSFHVDRPYLDLTGSGMPYVPPPGLRSAAMLAHLDETTFRCRYPYV